VDSVDYGAVFRLGYALFNRAVVLAFLLQEVKGLTDRIAIPLGFFWLNPKTRTVTILGSGNQCVSMSTLSIVGAATAAVLSNPSQFSNRPAYFADTTISTNVLIPILNEITEPEEWTTVKVPVESLLEDGMRLWEEDTAKGVENRLDTASYKMLGTYGVFEEGNRYGADFGGKVEEGFGRDKRWLKGVLRECIGQS
jgi:hypothetical protein